MGSDGHTYDRIELQTWINTSLRSRGYVTSPLSRHEMDPEFTTNWFAKKVITEIRKGPRCIKHIPNLKECEDELTKYRHKLMNYDIEYNKNNSNIQIYKKQYNSITKYYKDQLLNIKKTILESEKEMNKYNDEINKYIV